MQNSKQPRDYSEFYLKAEKEFRFISEAVNNKQYDEAEKHAMNALVEMKMLFNSLQLLREKEKQLWGKNYGQI